MIKDGRAEWHMVKIAVYMPENFDSILLNFAFELGEEITIISNDCSKIKNELTCIDNISEKDLKNFEIFVLKDNSVFVMDMKFYDIKQILNKLTIKMLVIH